MLIEVGGLSKAEFAAFVSRWRDFVTRPEGVWFDHETHGCYAAPMLIPAELREAERVGKTFDRCQIPVIRREIDRAVSDWIAAHRPVT